MWEAAQPLRLSIAAIMADGALVVADKRKKLAELWPGFQQALASSKYLTRPDRENIATASRKI